MRNVPCEIRSDGWQDYVAKFPLAFAQVREDALIDQWVESRLPFGSRGIMIASGGCTAALLAASGKFERLTVVDMNPAQLELTKLKIAFVGDYDRDDRLRLLGHWEGDPANVQGSDSLSSEMLRHNVDRDVFGAFEDVSTIGLDHAGRYELLFARLRHVISDRSTTKALLELSDPAEQMQFIKSNPAYIERLKQGFTEVMALPNLVRLFGEQATQNSVLTFSEHFYRQTLNAIERLPAGTNPYLAQLLFGSFAKDSVYPWFELPRQPINTRIDFRETAMAQALQESVEKFDFIHLSNILDWLSKDWAKTLLELASAKLKRGGWLIIRQLNSDLPIVDLCRSLVWKRDIAARLHAEDRSFFYQKLHVARKE